MHRLRAGKKACGPAGQDKGQAAGACITRRTAFNVVRGSAAGLLKKSAFRAMAKLYPLPENAGEKDQKRIWPLERLYAKPPELSGAKPGPVEKKLIRKGVS